MPWPARPGQRAYCHVFLPWSAQTQFKASGVYPLPWEFQVAATYQNLAGFPDAASFVATNSQIAPSLGRNLGQCGTSATCNGTATISSLFAPNTIFEDRLSQLDLRFTKIVRVGRARVQGMFDIYNLFNSSTILSINSRYGPTWLQPTTILGARLFKFGAQFDF